MRKPLLVCGVLASLVACEKAKAPENHGSGAMTRTESDLLTHLPSGAHVVFGGSFYNLQKRLRESALGRASAAVTPPALMAYNDCMAGKNLDMAGTATFEGDELSVRVYMRGITVADLDTCAKSAGLPAQLDPDGQMVVIETAMQDVTTRMPYLAYDHGVYGVVAMGDLGALAGGAKPSVRTPARADLEREVAGLAQHNAAGDARIAKLLPKIDRRKMMWFAGSAEGTPLDDKLELGYGSFDVASGISIDVTVVLADPADGDHALQQFRDMRSKLSMIPANMSAIKDVVRAIRLEHADGGLRFQVSLTDAQVDAVMEQIGPMLPKRF